MWSHIKSYARFARNTALNFYWSVVTCYITVTADLHMLFTTSNIITVKILMQREKAFFLCIFLRNSRQDLWAKTRSRFELLLKPEPLLVKKQ